MNMKYIHKKRAQKIRGLKKKYSKTVEKRGDNFRYVSKNKRNIISRAPVNMFGHLNSGSRPIEVDNKSLYFKPIVYGHMTFKLKKNWLAEPP